MRVQPTPDYTYNSCLCTCNKVSKCRIVALDLERYSRYSIRTRRSWGRATSVLKLAAALQQNIAPKRVIKLPEQINEE